MAKSQTFGICPARETPIRENFVLDFTPCIWTILCENVGLKKGGTLNSELKCAI